MRSPLVDQSFCLLVSRSSSALASVPEKKLITPSSEHATAKTMPASTIAMLAASSNSSGTSGSGTSGSSGSDGRSTVLVEKEGRSTLPTSGSSTGGNESSGRSVEVDWSGRAFFAYWYASKAPRHAPENATGNAANTSAIS